MRSCRGLRPTSRRRRCRRWRGISRGRLGPASPFQADDADVARAEQAAVAGACTTCHLGNYHGNNSDVPRVAGEQPAYLERTTKEMKAKVRANSPFMTTLLSTYDDADLAALAHWMAGM